MKSWPRLFAIGLLMVAALPAAPVVAAPSAEQILLDKANYWRLKNRPDLALQALQQLLSIEPNQPDALYRYGMIELQQGQIGEAKAYLARLQKAASASPEAADLDNAIRAGQVSPSQLSEARRLAQSGQFAQAAKQYEQTFKGSPPPPFGVEYYMTLAGTPKGWDEARRGLAALVQSAPGDAKARLALAEVLTYRAETRAQGIAMLAELSADPVIGTQAVAPWRRALTWLGAGPADRQLYDQYLARYPQDAEIRGHIEEAEKAAAAGPVTASAIGYDNLNRGDLAAAERRFAGDLAAKPGDADALAGLGLVRLRQHRFGEARDLLGQAIAAAPDRRDRWAEAYKSASFWAGIDEAKAAIAAADYRRARARLTGLVSQPSELNWNAELLLGDVDSRLGDHAAAERTYRRVLAAHPDNAAALVGLYTALTAQGKTHEAARLSGRVAALGPSRLAGVNRARADILRAEGKSLEARGDAAGAQAKYQEAIAAAPNDAWARLDYARFLARRGVVDEAFRIIDPAASGASAESLYAAAIFYNEQHRAAAAVALLDRIPAASRSRDVTILRDRVLVAAEVERARQLARDGSPADARALLLSLYGRPPASPAKTRLIADALADIGDLAAALRLARPDPGTVAADPRAALDYAALLFKAGRDAEAAGYLARAESSPHLDADARRELGRLRIDIAARRADDARRRGDLADAYDQISPLLVAHPNDPTLLLAAGRIYAAARRGSMAMRFVDAAYQQAPDDLDVIRGVVGGAIVAGDLDRAKAYLDAAMQRYPRNPRLYYLAAQIARANGDNGTAVHDLEIARRLDWAQSGGSGLLPSAVPAAAPALPAALPPNPFRQSRADQPRTPAMLAAAQPLVSANDASATPLGMPARLEPLPPPPIEGYQPPLSVQPPPAPRDSLQLDIEQSMAAIAAETGPILQGGLSWRARGGEDGLSRLTEIGVPLEASFSPFYTGTVRLRAVPDFLTAGTPAATSLTRFGHEALLASGPGTSLPGLPPPGSQDAGGIALNIGYAYRMFAGEVGTTPLGFPIDNVVGRVALMWPGPAELTTAYPDIPPPPTAASRPLHVKIEGVRRPVTDSLLSYAGTKDPVSGLVWGGVVKTGGDALVSYDDGIFGMYGGGGASAIDGKSVVGNSEVEGIVGAFVRPYRSDGAALKVGLNLSYMGYDKNLRFFSFGQGGYFSPQNYVNISVPLEYSGRDGRFSWLAGAALGLQSFHEKSSPYFPTEPASQAAAAAALGNPAVYPARTVTGPAFFLNGQLEYRLDNGFTLGGLASVDNAQNFTEGVARVYLRKSFGVPPSTSAAPNPFAGSL